MQPESHPFEKEKYLPILPNKKTQGMVDSKRTSCPGCMRFHMVSKPSGASQKHKKKRKRQKHPTTPPLCVVRKITKTTSFMLKPQNLMGFLALHLLQFSRKLPKIFTHTCCGNEAQSHAQSGPGSPGQHFSIVTASQQLCWYTLCTNKAPVVAPNLDHSKWGSPNFQSLQKERQMILVFRVDGKTYCIWSKISLLSFSKDTSWKWKILVGMTACKDVNRFNFADQKGHF